MRIRPRLFLTMASLALMLGAVACSGGAEAATGPIPTATPYPTFSLIPTQPIATAVTYSQPAATPLAVVNAPVSLAPVPAEIPTLVPRPTSTSAPATFRAPEPPPAATAILIPTVRPTSTPEPTPIPVVVAIKQPTPTAVPSATPIPATQTPVPATATTVPTSTPVPATQTPVPAPAPAGFVTITGSGNSDSASFVSPGHLPWELDWQVKGEGPNTFTVWLVDADGDVLLSQLFSETGTGQIGGVHFVYGNMGTFYLRVQGTMTDWTFWIRN
jgi:hypothetical protein